MESNVRLGVFVDPCLWAMRMLKRYKHLAQTAQLLVARDRRRQTRGHTLDRGPHLDDLENLFLGLTHYISAATRDRSDETLLLKSRQRFANWRATYAEALREIALVELWRLRPLIDIHARNRITQGDVHLVLETG